MIGHEFNFDGCEYLTKMGASWFVSYSYFLKKDKTHLNWQNVETISLRTNVYNQTAEYHKYWMEQIIGMNNNLLNKNQLGLDAEAIKNMAQELLSIMM